MERLAWALVLLAGVLATHGATDVEAAQSLDGAAVARRSATRQMVATGAFRVLSSVAHTHSIGELAPALLPRPTCTHRKKSRKPGQ